MEQVLAMVPWFPRIYKEPALPCVTHNKMDNVTINVLDSKGNVVMLTVSKDIAERMQNGK